MVTLMTLRHGMVNQSERIWTWVVVGGTRVKESKIRLVVVVRVADAED